MTIATDMQSISTSIKLTKLLHLFRFPAEIVVVTEFDQDPSESTYNQWSEFISEDGKDHPEVDQKEITKFMRLRELMKDRSGNSAMVISSLFLPKVTFEKQVWVSLVDFISYSMPPFIWFHGNNENVITFSA